MGDDQDAVAGDVTVEVDPLGPAGDGGVDSPEGVFDVIRSAVVDVEDAPAWDTGSQLVSRVLGQCMIFTGGASLP